MKRKGLCLVIGILFFLVAGSSHAEGVRFSRLGANGSISLGGDIEDSNLGFGAQTELSINRNVGIELALSYFNDKPYHENNVSVDLDMISIGFSAVFRASLAKNMNGYLLGGLDYNIADTDASLDSGSSFVGVSVDVDDEIGFHIGGGLDFTLSKNLELFAEYRYTFLDLDGSRTFSAGGVTFPSADIDVGYDFGLLKVGLNYLF